MTGFMYMILCERSINLQLVKVMCSSSSGCPMLTVTCSGLHPICSLGAGAFRCRHVATIDWRYRWTF